MNVLIIEDEPLIALEIEDALATAGHTPAGTAARVDAALALVDAVACDVAALDANLAGESARPVADRLRAKGIPFVVLSGYTGDQIGDWGRDAPLVGKPFQPQELIDALLRCADSPAR